VRAGLEEGTRVGTDHEGAFQRAMSTAGSTQQLLLPAGAFMRTSSSGVLTSPSGTSGVTNPPTHCLPLEMPRNQRSDRDHAELYGACIGRGLPQLKRL